MQGAVFSPRGGTGGGIETGRVCFCVERRGGTGGGVKGGTVDKTDILQPKLHLALTYKKKISRFQ